MNQFLKLWLAIILIIAQPSLAISSNPDFSAIPGDTKFEFKYNIPAGSGPSSQGAAIVKSVYNQAMPRGPLTSSKLLRSVQKVKSRGNVKIRLTKAKKLLDSVLDNSPDAAPQAFFVRGTMYLLLGKFPEALADFNSALLGDPDNSYSADGAFAIMTFMWKDLSDEQRSGWASAIAGSMGDRLSTAKVKTSHDYILIAKLYYLAGHYDRAFIVADLGLQGDPVNSDLISIRTAAEEQIKAHKEVYDRKRRK